MNRFNFKFLFLLILFGYGLHPLGAVDKFLVDIEHSVD
ncbi:hypothetical protein BVAVS116_H0037 (plasmid) [Borreliella valaisiana VS116]|uniref:Uncharacterized protein n=1 Tax=Borreliella valaisiana VS116 TaxID=445987 RepID=C0R994_BORVA|nr:hypothetical protein BVAVS116_H0037 [Borreliella valaisiana VS116]